MRAVEHERTPPMLDALRHKLAAAPASWGPSDELVCDLDGSLFRLCRYFTGQYFRHRITITDPALSAEADRAIADYLAWSFA